MLRKKIELTTAMCVAVSITVFARADTASSSETQDRPNILWIVTEDQSPNIGCYGETAIQTPALDELAATGVRFSSAYVTCPVCSPCRSALASGMYQTTLGSLNHRSQRAAGHRDGNADLDYAPSYALPTKTVMQLFHEHGYYVSNKGKTDYNWVSTERLARSDWTQREEGQPFFTQIQLGGGKKRPKNGLTAADEFDVPPYYPDDPVVRADWASYLNSWIGVDQEVKGILADLKRDGLLENTAIFFITDHGVSTLRGKQYCYEEGVHVPLLVRLPGKKLAGTVRADLVLQIDLAATSLSLAGIPIPDHMQGRALFATDYVARDFVVSARDRCGGPVDIIRSVRSGQYKYIRNFISFRPHSRRDQYKDTKLPIRRMRELHAEGKLNELQARPFDPTRPPEELYDLENDPFETVNLAASQEHHATLFRLRQTLYNWMVESRDMGLIPEPFLEDWGRAHGSKYFILQQEENQGLVSRLVRIMEAGELKDLGVLRAKLDSPCLPEQYWAITWLGVHRDEQAVDTLKRLSESDDTTIRVAANLALCRSGRADAHLPRLIADVDDSNSLAGMYALDAIEQTNILNDAVKKAATLALKSKYDNNTRFGRRLLSKYGQPSRYYVEYAPELYSYLYQPYSRGQPYVRTPTK